MPIISKIQTNLTAQATVLPWLISEAEAVFHKKPNFPTFHVFNSLIQVEQKSMFTPNDLIKLIFQRKKRGDFISWNLRDCLVGCGYGWIWACGHWGFVWHHSVEIFLHFYGMKIVKIHLIALFLLFEENLLTEYCFIWIGNFWMI